MSTPWMKFYASDWRADAGLRSCSLAARGMWIELLCLMWGADPKGSLLIAGKQPNAKTLAAQTASTLREVETALAELADNAVYSRDNDGTIFSRRMRRDVEKAARDKANGSSGGNPGLKASRSNRVKGGVNPLDNREVNPKDNPMVKGGDKAQKPEARDNPKRERDLLGKNTGQAGSALPPAPNGSAYAFDDSDGGQP